MQCGEAKVIVIHGSRWGRAITTTIQVVRGKMVLSDHDLFPHFLLETWPQHGLELSVIET